MGSLYLFLCISRFCGVLLLGFYLFHWCSGNHSDASSFLCKESSVIQDSSVQEGFYISLAYLYNSLVSRVISKLCGISEKFSGFGELIVFSPYLFLGIKGEVWWTWPKSSFLYPTFKNYHVMSYFLYGLTNFLSSVHVADFCVQISLHSLYLDFLFFPNKLLF